MLSSIQRHERSASRRMLLAGTAALLAPLPVFAETATKEKVMAALPKLKDFARQIVDKKQVPGLSIAVVYRDEVVLLDAAGVRDVNKPEPVDVDTVFQLASVSKPLASTVVAALVSDGTVSWDSRIRDIDPGFALHDELASSAVTVRDLFAHRSGLSGTVGNDIEEIGVPQGEILQRLRLAKPAYSFRSGYAYSNFGLTEGAVAAARISGKSWEEACEEKLYKPLGMTSSSSRYRDFVNQPNRAALHVPIDGVWAAFTRRDADAQAPAGGANSNARDLAQWMRLQLANGQYDGRQLIKKEAIDPSHVPASVRGVDPKTGNPSFYGLGWNVDYREHGVEWSHAGAFSAGARTLVHLIPGEHLGIAVLANAFPTGVPEGIAYTFFDLVFTGKPTRDWVAFGNEIFAAGYKASMKQSLAYLKPPASPAPALPPSAYLGDYRNDYVGEAKVSESGGALYLHLGPAGRRFPLTRFNRDLFVYVPYAETPQQRAGVTFLIGPDGRASEATIENLNDDGLGRLPRVGAK
jgi:CubicO group peptidase (beta-lactamase class C family)